VRNDGQAVWALVYKKELSEWRVVRWLDETEHAQASLWSTGSAPALAVDAGSSPVGAL
jgi:hypothetical protein